MKLSWTDIVTTVVAFLGGAVVYAKFYDYSWAIIGSWRSAVAVLAAAGVVMFAFSRFDFSNFSVLNVLEMILGVAAIGLAVTGMIVVSHPVFYILAATLGAFWLLDTARHFRHSMVDEGASSYNRHAHIH